MSLEKDITSIKEDLFKAADAENTSRREEHYRVRLDKELAEYSAKYPVGSEVTLKVMGSDREAFNNPERYGKLMSWVISRTYQGSSDLDLTAIIDWKDTRGENHHTSYISKDEFDWGINTKQMKVLPPEHNKATKAMQEAEEPLFKAPSEENLARREEDYQAKMKVDPNYQYWKYLFEMVKSEFRGLDIRGEPNEDGDFYIEAYSTVPDRSLSNKSYSVPFAIWIHPNVRDRVGNIGSIMVLKNVYSRQEDVAGEFRLNTPKEQIMSLLKNIMGKK